MSNKIVLSGDAKISFRKAYLALDELADDAEACGAGLFAHDIRGHLVSELHRLVDNCDVEPLSDEELYGPIQNPSQDGE